MSNPTFTVNVKGQPLTFTSAFADLASAYAALAAIGNPGDFALSLMEKARARQLSPSQIAWLHKLATDARPVESLNLRPIVEMMERAAAAQKRAPRITLQLTGAAKLVLSMCGPQSRTPGAVAIHNGGEYQSLNTRADATPRLFYGLIQLDGSVMKRSAWTSEVETMLRLLADAPLAVAKQHGVATGNCCFCGRDLSTAESRSVGYGPICASKFGLEWGDTTAADEADKEAKQALTFDLSKAKPADPRIVRLSSPNSGDRFQGD